MIGGEVIQTLILLWVTWRTDWNKEVCFMVYYAFIDFFFSLVFVKILLNDIFHIFNYCSK